MLAVALLGATWMACAASAAEAQTAPPTNRATGTGNARVLRPLSFMKTRDMHFGQIIAGTAPGQVVLDPDGSRTVIPAGTPTRPVPGTPPTLIGGTVSPAMFVGWGTYLRTVTISSGSNTIALTNGRGGTMTVTNMLMAANPETPLSTVPRVFTISSRNGAFSFVVGGTLNVGANQAPGDYVGTFTVTLNYN